MSPKKYVAEKKKVDSDEDIDAVASDFNERFNNDNEGDEDGGDDVEEAEV